MFDWLLGNRLVANAEISPFKKSKTPVDIHISNIEILNWKTLRYLK